MSNANVLINKRDTFTYGIEHQYKMAVINQLVTSKM